MPTRGWRPAALILLMAVLAGVVATVATQVVGERAAAAAEVCAPTAPSHCASATPTAGLSNEQVVQVTWRGMPSTSSEYMNLMICKASPTTAGDCTRANWVFKQLGDSGTEPIQVLSGQEVAAVSGLLCDAATPCSVAAFLANPGNVAVRPQQVVLADIGAVVIPLTFARSADLCPNGLSSKLRGEGGSASDRIFLNWGGRVCEAPMSIDMDSTTQSSPLARADFLKRRVDFGVTTRPITDAEKQAAADDLATLGSGDAVRDFAYAPVTITGLVLAFNIRDKNTSEQMTRMVLTPDMVARMFLQLGNFLQDDVLLTPEWRALNKRPDGQDWAIPPVGRYMRAEESDDTFLFTSWLWELARSEYVKATRKIGETGTGDNPYTQGPMSILEPVEGLTRLQRADAVARNLLNPNAPDPGFGTIGVVDSSVAAKYGLPTVTIRDTRPGCNRDVEFNPTNLLAGIAAMKPNPEGTTSIDFQSAPCGSYPMPKVSWMVVPTGDSSGHTDWTKLGPPVRAMVDYAAGAGQSLDPADPVLPVGYVALPDDLKSKARAVRDEVPVTNPPPAESTSTTAPPDSGSGSGSGSGGGTGGGLLGDGSSGGGGSAGGGESDGSLGGGNDTGGGFGGDGGGPGGSDGGSAAPGSSSYNGGGGSGGGDGTATEAGLARAVPILKGAVTGLLLPAMALLMLAGLGVGPFLGVRGRRSGGAAPGPGDDPVTLAWPVPNRADPSGDPPLSDSVPPS
jgi:ABC-type phosphate transport system substrate-binding protein